MGDAGRLPKRELGLYAGSWVAASSSSSPEISLAVRGRKVLEEGWEVERAVVALVVVLLIAKGKLDFAADASQRRLLYLSASDQPSALCLSVYLSVGGMRSAGGWGEGRWKQVAGVNGGDACATGRWASTSGTPTR